MSNSSVCSILDMPDEILVMIILHFNVRERLPLANSCQRFNNLVFGDKELLRDLDFTGERHLTRASDIQQYFNHENTYKKILRINTKDLQAVRNLSSSIGKAINLVQLNILGGLQFKSVEELSRFLKPLVHLKRLSFDWPELSTQESYHDPNRIKILDEQFGRLTYLSLRTGWSVEKFPLILQFCHRLEELHMDISSSSHLDEIPLYQRSIKLSNLRSVWLIGNADCGAMRRHIMCFVTDPAEWTDFYLADPDWELWLARNVEVCPELSQVKKMRLPDNIDYWRKINLVDKGWALVHEHLLSEVIRITHDNVPKKFCCLSWSQYSDGQPCELDIEEAKELLKDPLYDISYLRVQHLIEKNCDVHLLASAFPNLTKLLLPGISNKNSPENTQLLHRRLRKKGSSALEEENDARNTDTSFKILVENTPRLEVLEIFPEFRENEVEDWDLEAWYLISGWKNLTVIRLHEIPITDGQFLINIGKECKKLEEVTLHHLYPLSDYSYESELLQMLQHCKNLRKFSFQGLNLHLSEMFNTLSNCSRLATLSLGTFTKECDTLELESSVEEMFHQCQELERFAIDLYSHGHCHSLEADLKRISRQLNRSNFQFHINCPHQD